ncbi:MAG TPA: helix-turn-helix domain-containing protein [Candidatus Dojkabacteria bacterium]|jgi:DNA-binding winged helix-turn-helix (wHTH) protein|nr:helix-turn-helix domain-containing protein [Candidatus Dojkabacteria bacterium]
MKKSWYQEIYQTVDDAIKFRIPVEIVHFPSTGITSSINKLAHIYNSELQDMRFLIVDMDAARFVSDPERNRYEFFRVIRSHLEQQLNIVIEQRPDQNIYNVLEKILQEFILTKTRVFIVLETTARLRLEDIPEFWDLLIFVDRLRDRSEGAINIVLTSTYPLFDDLHPSPIPMITRYFNYNDPGRLYKTVNEDIFGKKLSSANVLKMIEYCDGLVAVIKAMKLDMSILDLKFEDIDFNNLNKEFFNKFISTKQALDRIRNKAYPKTFEVYRKIYRGEELTEKEEIYLRYLNKIGLIKEDRKISGKVLPQYLDLYLQDIKELHEPPILDPIIKAIPVETPKKEASQFDPNEYYLINDHIQINKLSGEIFFKHKISSEYLTEKELIIFKCLYDKANNNVSKEEIGKALWGERMAEEYSEWAIDKLISRIRVKLDDLKPFKVIRTIRGYGYCLYSNQKETPANINTPVGD